MGVFLYKSNLILMASKRIIAPKGDVRPIAPMAPRGKTTPIKIWSFITVLNFKLATNKDSRVTGAWLKDELVELGPAFIKIGQFVSTRTDVFDKDITSELKGLQDSINPTPFEDIEGVLKAEFGIAYKDTFKSIDPKPLASASIGQVHKAVLLRTGKQVAIKVQKPHIAEQIRSDIVTLKGICSVFKALGVQRAIEFENVLKQYEDFLTGELDYLREQENMMKFIQMFEDDDVSVVIPKPLDDFSTPRVLVMEYVPSTKITDFLSGASLPKGKSKAQLADELMDMFLYQIIMFGMVHCDPHPGNVGVSESGQLVLYDFGNVAFLGEGFRSNVKQLIVAVYQKDVDEFLDLLLKMNIVQSTDPLEVLELKSFFSYVLDYLEKVDFQKLRESVLENDVLQQSQVNFKIDPQFLSLFRVFSLLDGTCLALNPSFSYLPVLEPYFQEVFTDMQFIDYRIRRDVEKLTSFPKLIKNTDNNILQINRRIEQMSSKSKNMKALVLLFVMLDTYNDPVRFAVMLPLVILIVKEM